MLTENGLYEVLMLSRKPIAKQFKTRVKEILKTIRKTGSYSVPKTPSEQIQLIAQGYVELEQTVNGIKDDVTDLKGQYAAVRMRNRRGFKARQAQGG